MGLPFLLAKPLIYISIAGFKAIIKASSSITSSCSATKFMHLISEVSYLLLI